MCVEQKDLSSSLSCLSLMFVCLVSIVLLFNAPMKDLGKYQRCFEWLFSEQAGFILSATQEVAYFWQEKKWKWRERHPLFLQDSGASSHRILSILRSCYVAREKTRQSLIHPSLTEGMRAQKLFLPSSDISGSHKSYYFSLISFVSCLFSLSWLKPLLLK